MKLKFFVISLLLLAQAAYAVEQEDPSQLVRKTADSLLEILRTEKIEQETAKEQLNLIIDNVLSPVIDFRRLAYRTMAKYYKQASTEQFLAFTQAIKQSLINTYAGPLVESDSRLLAEKLSVEIREVQNIEGKTPRTVVYTWLKIGNNQQYDVIYYFYFNKSRNSWLVENVVIEGINLLITFRNQYQRLASENNGDIDKVTQLWVEPKS